MMSRIKNFLRDENGAEAMEYAIFIGVIVVALAGVAAILATVFNNVFTGLEDQVGGGDGG